VAAKRGRTLTSFGFGLFWTISGGETFVPVIPTATGEVYTPSDEGIVKIPPDTGNVYIPPDSGKVKSYGPT